MNISEINQLKEQLRLAECTYSQLWLGQLAKFANNPAKLKQLAGQIEQTLSAQSRRQQLCAATQIIYPPELPVSREVAAIKEVIQNHQLSIICGETGSGKTTQLPKILLELGYAARGIIGHTQPRRIAARSLAARISHELNPLSTEQTNLVGYKMRFHDRTSPNQAIKLMTDGILLQEIQSDRLLLQYSAIIIDEVHERSLNIDFILGYIQQLLVKRRDLKVVITSATLENEKLAKFFNAAPVVNVSGKTYPVDIIYQPLGADGDEGGINQAVYQAICASLSVERGNGLVFLPGEREIKNCLTFLRKTELKNYELLALYARQNNEEQSLIFKDTGRIKIILATNIAETSLTIPGIKFVIDSGIARVKRYSIRNRVEQLQIENISQASSKQRAGRAGRLSHGLCVRLFSEQEFNLRAGYTEPEILRSNLANVILRLLSLNLGDPAVFPFLDQPEAKAFNDGFRTLFQVGAIDAANHLTQLGRKLAQIPLDVQLARILVAAGERFACLKEALVISAFLAIQDPREFPLEQQQLVRERHSIWADKQSDFCQILNLWNWYHQELVHKKSNKKLLEICYKHFVSALRLREWHELHRQLKETMLGLGYSEGHGAASYQNLHSAILSGFVINVGQKDLVENYYLGTNSRKFWLHPSLQLNPAKWLVAANLVETSKLYARQCAYIEPLWLNGIANHLYKYTYSNQHWDAKRGEVVANKSALLYGLLISQQKISFGHIDPQLAREIMIKEGLVASNLGKEYAFLEHNQRVVTAVENLEDKLRTSLVLIEDELTEFYAQRLAVAVIDIPSLEGFLRENPEILNIDQAEFIQRLSKEQLHLNLYPDKLVVNGQNLELKYVFDHESPEDGLVVLIELSQLSEISPDAFAWLVPGLIREKLSYVLKSLPKNQRLNFNPLNETINDFLQQADSSQNFWLEIINYAKSAKKVELSHPDLLAISFPVQLRCHFRIMDKRALIASGDDLLQLKRELAPTLNKLVVKHATTKHHTKVTDYIPELLELGAKVVLNRGDSDLVGYQSLIVEKDGSISHGVVAELDKARRSSLVGLRQLLRLQLKEQQKYLSSKKPSNFGEISLALVDVYTKDELGIACSDYILLQAINTACPGDHLPLSSDQFQTLVQAARTNVTKFNQEFNLVFSHLAPLYRQVKLTSANHPLCDSIQLQLDDLIYPQFLQYTKWQFLQNYPRYLQAILLRLAKYSKVGAKDRSLEDEINLVYDKWYNYVDDLEHKHKAVATQLYDFKYKIEELRISLFAQELRTLYPVSVKRLLTELQQLYLTNLAESN